jgi:hypothetical protein
MNKFKIALVALCLMVTGFSHGGIVCPSVEVVKHVPLNLVDYDEDYDKYFAGAFFLDNQKEYVVVTGLFDHKSTALQEGQALLLNSLEPEVDHDTCIYYLDAQHMKFVLVGGPDGVTNLNTLASRYIK